MRNDSYHEPVLTGEVQKALAPLKNARIIDATLGTGGHTLEFVKKGAHVLGLEADSEMLTIAGMRLKKACPTPNRNGLGSFKLIHANFKDIESIASKEDFREIDAVLFDLGVSNLQLTSKTRGFSFSNLEAPLDMRIDRENQGLTAKDILNALREDQLEGLFGKVLKTRDARFLAKLVIERREKRPFETVGDFLSVGKRVSQKKDLHPGTLPFLALRMAVNSELENVKEALPRAFSLVRSGGKILVITFHSGEEREVLNFFFERQRAKEAKILTGEPITPGKKEVFLNPRARSAELYILQKI